MRLVALLCFFGFALGQTGGPAFTIPPPAVLKSLVHRSFVNVDQDKDGFIEYYEFDTLIIVADTDNDGCMTKKEYEGFSAAPAAIADQIFDKFDPQHNNCITVNAISAEFAKMDTNGNNQVTEAEFETYYVNLLNELLHTNTTTPPNTTVVTV